MKVGEMLARLQGVDQELELIFEAEEDGPNVVSSIAVEPTCNEGEQVCRVYLWWPE